jgi:hypothetical protein
MILDELLINSASEGLFRVAWFSCFSDNFKLALHTGSKLRILLIIEKESYRW